MRDDAKATLKAAYKKAIVVSTESGFTQDAALAAQLASEAIQSEREMYWERACGIYLRWGATALLVRYLNQQEEHDPSSTLTISSSMRSEGASDYASETRFRVRTIFAGMSEQPFSSELLLFNATRSHQVQS